MRFLVDVLSGLLKLSLILQKTYFENQIILLHLLLRNWQRIRNSLHKGFLNTKDIDSVQADLGIEVILKLFRRKVWKICLKLQV
jgi:hypothetical protein